MELRSRCGLIEAELNLHDRKVSLWLRAMPECLRGNYGFLNPMHKYGGIGLCSSDKPGLYREHVYLWGVQVAGEGHPFSCCFDTMREAGDYAQKVKELIETFDSVALPKERVGWKRDQQVKPPTASQRLDELEHRVKRLEAMV